MKKRYIITTILLTIALILTMSVTYAWWSNGLSDKEFSFTSAKVASTMRLFKGNDFDLDGIFDFETGFTEEIKKDENKENSFTLVINDFAPTEAYTYQMNVINNGDVTGYVVMALKESALSNNLVRCLSMSLWNGTQYEGKCFLGSLSSNNLIILGGRQADNVEPNSSGTAAESVGRNFIFKIEFETEQSLLEQGITIDKDIYQSLQNQSFELDFFEFILSSQFQ